MPRLLSSYAANKRVEDGLKRKQEQIRLDYIRATHRHLDETEKLVDDLIHINVRTSAFDFKPSININGHPLNAPTVPKSALLHQHQQPFNEGSQQTLDSEKEETTTDKQSLTSPGISPSNFRTELATKKAPGHPIIQVRGNEVFYQYQKQRKSWKKVEPSYKTKLLLHRNNTVIKALNNFNSRNDELSEKTLSEDTTFTNSTTQKQRKSIFSDPFRRESMFSRRASRRDSRMSYLGDRKESVNQVMELTPPLSPGHTPRMLNGWTIMKWCLWNKKQMTPVWATRRYAETKHREYQQFMASRKKTEEQTTVAKPNSANSSSRKEQRSRESLVAEEAKPSLPRAKSVPASIRINVDADQDTDTDTDHFPNIDRGIIRPTTSILRATLHDDVPTSPNEKSHPKSTPQRRVALDTCVNAIKDVFSYDSDETGEVGIYSPGRKILRPASKHTTWGILTETENESADED